MVPDCQLGRALAHVKFWRVWWRLRTVVDQMVLVVNKEKSTTNFYLTLMETVDNAGVIRYKKLKNINWDLIVSKEVSGEYFPRKFVWNLVRYLPVHMLGKWCNRLPVNKNRQLDNCWQLRLINHVRRNSSIDKTTEILMKRNLLNVCWLS